MRPLPALLLALVAACSDPAARISPAAPPVPAPASTPVAAPEPVDGEPVLIDPGAEPRYQLRYRAPVGTLRTSTTAMSVNVQVPGVVPRTILPTTVYAGSQDVIEVTDDGNFTMRTTLDDIQVLDRPGADPATVEAMKTSMANVGELRISRSFDVRGKKLDARVETDGDAARDNLARQSMESANDGMPRLPEQPVGKGGRWRVKTRTLSHGVELDNECEFEVVDVTATTMHLRSTGRRTALRQNAVIGQTAMIVEGSGTSGNDLTLDLTTLVGDLTGRLDLALTLDVVGDSARQLTLSGEYTGRWR